MNKDKVKVGDRVRCHLKGSWVDNKEGTVIALDTVSSDNIYGHVIQMDKGITILPRHTLEVIRGEK